jgi:predicted TIM-barrel fold metal-dependent hydrolase
MAALHRAFTSARGIVTPSVYGTDNSATLYGMKARGATARGVAVVDDKTPESELDAMNAAGIRGIRINLATGGINDPAVARQRLQAAIDRAKGHNWHVQIYSNLPVIAALKSELAQSPVPLVLDHFAGAQAALGVDQPAAPADRRRPTVEPARGLTPDAAIRQKIPWWPIRRGLRLRRLVTG